MSLELSLRNWAPIDALIGRQILDLPVIDVTDEAFGADPTGTTDSLAAIEAAIAYAETVANGVIGGYGAIVDFPAGWYKVSSGFDQPNRVMLRGNNGFNTIIGPTDDFAGTDYLVRNINGTSSSFFCFIENIWFRANHNPAITRVIEANAWNEHCGLRRVQVGEFCNTGVLVQNGYGGSASFRIEDSVFYLSTTVTSGRGIKINLDFVTGFSVAVLNQITSYAHGTATDYVGVEADDGVLMIDGFHSEYARAAVLAHGRCRVVAKGVTGSPNAVTSVFEFADSHSTTISGAHLVSDTTINVASTAAFPSTGVLYYLGELIQYTGKTATSFTGCTRGLESSTRQAASGGETIYSGWSGSATLTGCVKGGATNLVLRNTGSNASSVVTHLDLSGHPLLTGIVGGASTAPNLNRGRTHIINIGSIAGKTIDAPTGDFGAGAEFVLAIRNNNVASVSVSFNAVFKVAGYTNPATNKTTTATFRYVTGTGNVSIDGFWWQVGAWSPDI